MTMGTCQSNNLIHCLECNCCHTKYVGQTKNRIIDRFQGHIFDIKHNHNTTVARHFESHSDHLDPNMTIQILECIRLPKDLPRSNSLRGNRELVWIHRLNTLIPKGLNILDWVNKFRMSQRVYIRGNLHLLPILSMSKGRFSMNGNPLAPLIFG